MKSLLTIPLLSGFKTTVEKGQAVKVGDILARKTALPQQEKIPVSKILSVSPKKVVSYLRKKLGQEINKGEILAKKEGVLKSINILSPITGKIESVNFKDGTLLIVSREIQELIERAPIDAIVEEVDGDKITLSFEGKVMEVEDGRGERAIGSTLVFNKHIDIPDFASEVVDKIIIARSFTNGALAKLNALGASGVMSLEFYDDFPVMVKLTKEQYLELSKTSLPSVIVLGKKKRIIVPIK